jgi:hypothetical protein
MGTSASKRDAPPGSVLIPPWADQDPPAAVEVPQEPQEEAPEQGEAPNAQPVIANERRYNGFRRRLGRYMATGDRDEGRKALGHWVRTSAGGPRAGTQRLARGIRLAGAVISGLASAGSGQPPAPGQLDIRSLSGLPSDVAVGRIVDAFCPPGIADEDAVRSAVGETLATVLAGADTFDPTAIDPNTVRLAILGFAAEIVFVSVASDTKDALVSTRPEIAIERENGLRNLIREVADIQGTPLLAAAGALLTPAAVSDLISRLITEVQAEMATWI